MKNRILMLCVMALLMELLLCPVSAAGEGTPGIGVRLSKASYQPGEQAEAVFFLENGSNAGKTFTGLQIDIEQIDETRLKPVLYESLIRDTEPLVNAVSYVPQKQRVRMLYARMDEGTQQLEGQDVMKVAFALQKDLAQEEILLPVTMKMTLSDDTSCTATASLRIACVPGGGESDVVTVDISWGSMEFTYTEDLWDPENHCYTGAGWADHGTGSLQVSCNGKPVTAELRYDSLLPTVTGSFAEAGTAVEGAVSLGQGQQRSFCLTLAGKPDRALENEKIGTVTVTLGGN